MKECFETCSSTIMVLSLTLFLPIITFEYDAISNWIEAKADEIRARAEKIRKENKNTINGKD